MNNFLKNLIAFLCVIAIGAIFAFSVSIVEFECDSATCFVTKYIGFNRFIKKELDSFPQKEVSTFIIKESIHNKGFYKWKKSHIDYHLYVKLKDGRIIYTYRKQCKNFDILKDIARKTKRRESFVFAR